MTWNFFEWLGEFACSYKGLVTGLACTAASVTMINNFEDVQDPMFTRVDTLEKYVSTYDYYSINDKLGHLEAYSDSLINLKHLTESPEYAKRKSDYDKLNTCNSWKGFGELWLFSAGLTLSIVSSGYHISRFKRRKSKK